MLLKIIFNRFGHTLKIAIINVINWIGSNFHKVLIILLIPAEFSAPLLYLITTQISIINQVESLLQPIYDRLTISIHYKFIDFLIIIIFIIPTLLFSPFLINEISGERFSELILLCPCVCLFEITKIFNALIQNRKVTGQKDFDISKYASLNIFYLITFSSHLYLFQYNFIEYLFIFLAICNIIFAFKTFVTDKLSRLKINEPTLVDDVIHK
jgi:hypothetical protein